jgi:hypothetical protein
MPIHVNELAVKEISVLTGVDEAKLKAELFVDGDKAPTETKVKELFTGLVIMPEKDHKTLIDNTGKTKFDEGKYGQTNQLVKLFLKDKAFDTKDMKREDVAAKITEHMEAEFEARSGKQPAEKEKEYKESLQKLQSALLEKEEALKKVNGDLENTKTFSVAERKVTAAVSSIPFIATGEKLSKQREIVEKNILSSYQHKIEDGVSVWYKDGKKLTDRLENPKTIEDIAKEEAIIFDISESSAGRGDNSSKHNNSSGNLDAELKNAPTMDDLSKLMTAKGLSAITSEGKALIARWAQIHKK